MKYRDLKESLAHKQANGLGLTYFGFGRYGKNSTVTHVNQAGRLTPVHTPYSASHGGPVLLHYPHLEDHVLTHGVKGAQNAIDTLHKLIHSPQHITTQTKIDGAPSLFFGKHPETGKFFVATKGLYNKDPKVNYTHEDIDRNHGESPGLATKLHHALDHLPKIYKGHGVLQGDMMFTPGDISHKEIEGKNHLTFKPNIVRNAIPIDSELGKKAAAAKIGFAVHTKYNDKGERLPADENDVKQHEDVFNMPISHDHADMTHHKAALQHIGHLIATTSKEDFEKVSHPDHQANILSYINSTVKDNSTPSFQGFMTHAENQHNKGIAKVKSDFAKKQKTETRDRVLADARQNQKSFENVLNVHRHIANLKNSIIKDLNQHQKIKRFFDNPEQGGMEPTGPEGYVSITHHGTSKLVQRHGGFSLKNFTQKKDWTPRQKEEKKTNAVVALGRFSPPHVEHDKLVHAVIAHAQKTGADPHVFVTHTQDDKRNPLTASEKIELLKMAHPDHKHIFCATDKKMPSLPHVLGYLHRKGYKNTDVVIGDDRKDEFEKMKQYNGKFNEKGEGYNFDNLNVLSRHEIHPNRDEQGNDGIHASDMRKWAMEGNFNSFRAGMNKSISDEHVKKVMNLIKGRLNYKGIKENIRERYIDGELLNEGDIVVNRKDEHLYEIVMCGTNYLNVVDDSGKMKRIWIEDAILANHLAEDFNACRRRRSGNNQIAFIGYKTQNFVKEHYEAFHPMIKSAANRFLLLRLIQSTDSLVKESLKITQDNYNRVKSLFEETERILKTINTSVPHQYRKDIVEKLNEYELDEGLQLTATCDKDRSATIIANAIGVDLLDSTENTVNRALVEFKSYSRSKDAWKLMGRMLNLATSSGIRWNKNLLSEAKRIEIGVK
jgi:hypothetical protein